MIRQSMKQQKQNTCCRWQNKLNTPAKEALNGLSFYIITVTSNNPKSLQP